MRKSIKASFFIYYTGLQLFSPCHLQSRTDVLIAATPHLCS